MPDIQTLLLRLLLSVLAGGLIGAEREYRSKSAGFRTVILICTGSCLFTLLSLSINPPESDRIAASIITGIGFVGAGVIFRSDNRVSGITTAATIWTTAAIGMGIGAGYYWAAAITCVIALLVLILFTHLESYIDKANQVRNYRIVCNYGDNRLKHYEKMFRHHRLSFKRGTQSRAHHQLIGYWIVQGSEKHHEAFIEEILKDETVTEFDF